MLTHSLIHNRLYVLKAGKLVVAEVSKEEGGFMVEKVLGAPIYDAEVRTMKETKEVVEKLIPTGILNPSPEPVFKNHAISIKDAKRMCAMSHTGLFVCLREVKRIWPEWPSEKYGPYFVRKHMEALARWPVSSMHGVKWLRENPKVGMYDHEEEERRILQIYGDGVTFN